MKGLFTQGVAVLFSEPPSLSQLRGLLEDYEITSENPLGTSHWETESASFRIACRPEVGGHCLLDVVSRSWPDHLSNSEREPSLHAAWNMGHFGPFAASGSLARAVEHAHRWPHAAQVAPQHLAFVRMRISYTLTGSGPPAALPPDYDPLPELEWLIKLARHISKHPRATAYFNPNGEVLLSPQGLQKVLDDAAHGEAPPLDAIVNVRLAHVAGWQLVDTIGMGQLDLPDQEIVCPDGVSSSEELSAFVFDAVYHMVTTEVPIVTDNSTTGPGGTEWVATLRMNSLREPGRRIVHWTETEGPYEPEEFFVATVEDGALDAAQEPWVEGPYSAFDDPANWEVPPPTLAPPPHSLLSGGQRQGGSNCLLMFLIVVVALATALAYFWPALTAFYRSINPPPATTTAAETDWEAEAAPILQNWQPSADLDAKAQPAAPAGYHTLVGEGRAGSGFLMRYAGTQIFCGVTTLHQFEGRTPASLDGPVGLRVLLDNQNVLKLRDVQVQQVTEVSRPFECLDYDPSFSLKPGDELIIPKGDGESVKGKMDNSLLLIDSFVSVPGHSQDFTLTLDQPFEFKGYSGSPVIKAATGKVVGVLRTGDATKKIIGFETLSLGQPTPPPAPPTPPPAPPAKTPRK
ncbi:MAG: hypothetical protein JWO94_3838 [Verrucomicrobiaceae bacterium]|nr:hypothetical protein [Verrucomicrobiaceae bacterium]